mgnify:FL=1
MDRYKEIDFMKCIEIIFVVVHLPIHSELNEKPNPPAMLG